MPSKTSATAKKSTSLVRLLLVISQPKTLHATKFQTKVDWPIPLVHILYRQVTKAKSKGGAVVKLQRMFVVNKNHIKCKMVFQERAAPLYRSLVTSLLYILKKVDLPKLLNGTRWLSNEGI